MPTLPQLVPDVDTLIGLGTEELGLLLLRVFNDPINMQNGMIHLSGFESQVFPSSGGQYALNRRDDALDAVREAFAWLEGQAFLIAPDSMNASAGWRKLGRRGRRLVSESGAADYKAASLLPRAVLHPAIKENVYFNFQRGDYQTAVYCAFREVELAVSNASKLKGLTGTQLMREAFRPVDDRPKKPGEEQSHGPLTDIQAEPAEQQACAHLFAGAFGYCRNPHSHKDIALKAEDAVHMLVLASYLLRIVDGTVASMSS